VTPYAIIVDDFFADFAAARRCALQREYSTQTNPYDSNQYPTVSMLPEDEPHELVVEAGNKIARIMSSRIAIPRALFRFTLADAQQPYQAHSDAFMGAQFTAIVYMNEWSQCKGGTALLRHRSLGVDRLDRETPEKVSQQLHADENRPEAWHTEVLVPMMPNRLLIIPADLIHRSEPVEGFGSGTEDGRLVMVISFDLQRE